MNHSPEIVAFDPENGFSSGGGFSSYFPRPRYQDAVVPQYVASLKGAFKGLFDPNGRAYPDISAQGFHYVVAWNGTEVLLDGTSCATPAASAVITLVNDALIAAGKPPLGFLNPWLYAGGFRAFTDITSGTAIGCDTAGFPAQEGWDAVSGWGTPVSFPSRCTDTHTYAYMHICGICFPLLMREVVLIYYFARRISQKSRRWWRACRRRLH
jgi:tripeptidyl-peptidase I